MSTYPRRDTSPELALRRALHGRGLRYRLQVPVPGNRRRKIDIAFPRARVGVYVDGCFWHGCADHGTQPTANAEWWTWKIERNRTRDSDTDRILAAAGWVVVRVWEHQDPEAAAEAVSALVTARRRAVGRSVGGSG